MGRMKMKIVKIPTAVVGAVGLLCGFALPEASAQVVTQGISPGSNTTRSFVDASIARDSGISQPLDLLNDFYPVIEVTIASHDNVRRRSDLMEDDLKVVAKPSLGYRANIGRHHFYAAYSGVFTFHDEIEQEDAQANSLRANLGLDMSTRWDLVLFAGLGDSYEERGVSGSRGFNQLVRGLDVEPDKVDFDYYGADLVYGKKISDLTAVLGFEKYSNSYKNNFQGKENPSGGRDRERTSLHLDLNYRIGSRLSVFGRIEETDIDYDRVFNSLDSDQSDYYIGLRWQSKNALNATVGIGKSDRDYIDPSRDDYGGSTYFANINYALSPFSNIELNASRAVEEPGDVESDYFVTDLIGVGWKHSFSSAVTFGAYAKWIEDDYNTERHDDFFDYGLSLDYHWRQWLTAGIYFGDIERDSSAENIAYEDQYFGIRFRSDLRDLLKGRRHDDDPVDVYDINRSSRR